MGQEAAFDRLFGHLLNCIFAHLTLILGRHAAQIRAAGFEPAISCSQGRRITTLSHTLSSQ